MTEQIEELKRKASVMASVAELIEQATQLLKDAKQIAKDHDIEISFDKIIEEVGDDSNNWYGSDQSLC